jgi:hypothetical protein
MYRGRGRSVSNRLPDPGRSRYTRFAGLLSLGISCQRRSVHPDIRRRISSVQLRRFYCLSSDMEVPLATVRHSVQDQPPFCVENGVGGSPARGRNPRGYNRSWKRRLPDRHYFNTLSGNTPFQVEFNRGPDLPDEGLFYGASIPEGWIGNYYGRSGFLPGITSNGTDLCPLEHPLPNNVPAEVFNSLRCEECSSEEFFSALQARSLDDPSGDVSQKIESHLEPCPE